MNTRSIRIVTTRCIIVLSLFSVILSVSCRVDNQDDVLPLSWTSLGLVSTGSSGEWWETYSGSAIELDPIDNAPVVAFRDIGTITVKKWEQDQEWTVFGNPGGGSYPDLAIDTNDSKPIAVSSSGTVSKWSAGTSWASLGNPDSGNFAGLVFDPVGLKPITVFADSSTDNKVHVLKWDSGTTWTDIGHVSNGGASYVCIAIGADGRPVVAYSDVDSGYGTRVKKWSTGTTWTDMSEPGSDCSTDIALVIDPLDGKPIVAARGDYGSIHVKKWESGTIWTDMGFPYKYTYEVLPNLAISPDGSDLLVVFLSQDDSQLMLYRWVSGTKWNSLNVPLATESAHPSIVIDGNRNIYLLFHDGQNGYRAHVAKAVWN